MVNLISGRSTGALTASLAAPLQRYIHLRRSLREYVSARGARALSTLVADDKRRGKTIGRCARLQEDEDSLLENLLFRCTVYGLLHRLNYQLPSPTMPRSAQVLADVFASLTSIARSSGLSGGVPVAALARNNLNDM
ncbi:unnamed protein product, partial [Iphiclides podalirius]